MTDPLHIGGDTAFRWTTIFFRTLYDAGVRHAVISPGSRSTPLTLAASAHPGFRKHVVLDERSAAFTALGIGKATGRPAVLICTSGTAVANYFPAVIEARMSAVPMILATADRPPHLKGTGANQTIDQEEIFGRYPVRYVNMGRAGGTMEDLRRLQRVTKESLETMRSGRGPLHLNFPFQKPLEPSRELYREVVDKNREHPRRATTPKSAPPPVELPLDEEHRNVLLVAGPLSPFEDERPIRLLARRLKAPLLAETFAGDRNMVAGFDGFLRDPELRRELKPDLLIRFGFQPTSRAVETALREWNDLPHIHCAHPANRHDATASVTRRIEWQGTEELRTSRPGSGDDWYGSWKAAAQSYGEQVVAVLGESGHLTDLHLYRHLVRQLPETWFHFVSNSFPVRDRLLVAPSTGSPCYVNRGASGIDGIISTAIGLAAARQSPGVLFTGDLAFLHDSNALLQHRVMDQPLIVVIANNSGGSIFRKLPVAEHAGLFETYFETPQRVDIGRLAEAHEVPYRRVLSADELQAIDLLAVAEQTVKGLHIIECRTDADRSMDLRNRLWGES